MNNEENKLENGAARGQLHTLVSCNDYIYFQIEITEKDAYFINASVYEIDSWDMDNNPCDKELYCKVYMKWDGCCHVWFGEEDEKGSHDGYLHLCGAIYWKRHIKMMEALYRFAEENIPSFTDDERWDATNG